MALFHYDFLEAYRTFGQLDSKKAAAIMTLAVNLVNRWDGGWLQNNDHIFRLASIILDEMLEKLPQDQDCSQGMNEIRRALFGPDSEKSEYRGKLRNGALPMNEDKWVYLQRFQTSLHLIASDEWYKDTYGYDLDSISHFADRVAEKESMPPVVREFVSHLHDRPEDLRRSDDPGDTIKTKKDRLDPRKNWWKQYHDLVKTIKGLVPEYKENEDYMELVNKAENIFYTCDRLGRYDPDMDRITLYLYPIMRWASDMSVSLLCAMQSVCDHELFCYYHFHFMAANMGSRTAWRPGYDDDNSKVNSVIEGLADYFAYTMAQTRYLYPRDEYSDGWKKIMKSYERKWSSHDFPLFPCAAADIFWVEENYSGRFPANKRKFEESDFLHLTWTDPKAPAFRVLLESLKEDPQNHWKNAWDAMLRIHEENKKLTPSAGKIIHGRKLNFTFDLCHIQPGETVEYIEDPTISAVVCDARHVMYKK